MAWDPGSTQPIVEPPTVGRPARGLAFYVETIGCQMNEQDSLRIAHQLAAAGYRRVFAADEADIFLVNTCCIRRKAEEKVYSLLGRLRAWKEQRDGRVLAVGGCVAQNDGAQLQSRMPHVDVVFGPHHIRRVERLLRRHLETGGRITEVALSEDSVADLACSGVPRAGGVRAYVTIMEGCNNFCSYCIVPYVRGRERSRPVASLRREVASLVAQGVRDITLLGQNVNAYRAPDREACGFPDLLREVAAVRGLERIRFTTSHPKDFSDRLISGFGQLEALCEHVHLPVQSGSDRTLARMNRQYTARHYRETIDRLRQRCPDVAVTTDVIVGFPGETEADFEATLALMEAVGFDGVFSFRFSPRAGTRASSFEETVPEVEKRERLEVLQALQRTIGLGRNRTLEGRVFELLVEGSSRDGTRWMGRTRTNKVVNFSCEDDRTGSRVRVRIDRAYPHSLRGTLCRPPA